MSVRQTACERLLQGKDRVEQGVGKDRGQGRGRDPASLG